MQNLIINRYVGIYNYDQNRPPLAIHSNGGDWRRSSGDISADEKLAELVRSYPVQNDKSSPHFRDKQKKTAAWEDVAQNLGLKKGKFSS